MCEKYLWATSKTMLLNKEISLDLKARNTASALVCINFFFFFLLLCLNQWFFGTSSWPALRVWWQPRIPGGRKAHVHIHKTWHTITGNLRSSKMILLALNGTRNFKTRCKSLSCQGTCWESRIFYCCYMIRVQLQPHGLLPTQVNRTSTGSYIPKNWSTGSF